MWTVSWRCENRRADAAREAERLEAEIGRLVTVLAAGTESTDVLAGIAERRTQVDALRRLAVEPLAVPPFDKAAFTNTLKTLGVHWLLTDGSPNLSRQVLRKVGVERITVTPDGVNAWTFEGLADLGHLINKGVEGRAVTAIRGWRGAPRGRPTRTGRR